MAPTERTSKRLGWVFTNHAKRACITNAVWDLSVILLYSLHDIVLGPPPPQLTTPLQTEFLTRVTVVREKMQLREQEIHGTWMTWAKMLQNNYSASLAVISPVHAIGVTQRNPCLLRNFHMAYRVVAQSNACKEGCTSNRQLLLSIPQHPGQVRHEFIHHNW